MYISAWTIFGSSGTHERPRPTSASTASRFEEASSAFADEHGLLLPDPDHSETEDRFILLGLSANIRLLVVVHAFRDEEDVIRIISARKADRKESRHYGAQI